MQLEIRHVNLEVSDALHEFARRRVERALRPFGEHVEQVDVRIEDVNGPRGGIDKRCSVTLQLAPTESKVVVKRTSADAYAAVQEACARLGESVSRALTRRRQLDRYSGPPTPADRGPATGLDREIVTPQGEGSGIQITTVDHERLRSWIETHAGSGDQDAAEALVDELEHAQLVAPERIAGNVVTMRSRVVLEDQQTGAAREVSLVYPQEAAPEQARISVLAPVGSALLGLSVGQTIDWPLPGGEMQRLRIAKIVYQPEEAGDFHL